MQYEIHRSNERGRGEYGWLSTRYSFSFADWYNSERMGFGALRVLNDDVVAPHFGFPMHSHKDMEIITVVTAGMVTHKDSLGNSGTVKAGEVQVMSAGSGVTHSEWNNADEPLKLFQIWIEPKERGVRPRYDQKTFNSKDRQGHFQKLLAGKSREGELWITQDAYLSLGSFDSGSNVAYARNVPSHGVYLFVIEGSIQFQNETLYARDALLIHEADFPTLTSLSRSEILVIEVPM